MPTITRTIAREVCASVEVLRGALEDLVLRGVRVASADDLRGLASLAADLRSSGAGYLAERVEATLDAVRSAKASAPTELMRTMAGLRVYERLLSLGVAEGELARAFLTADGQGGAAVSAFAGKGTAAAPPDLDRKGALPVAEGVVSAIEELLSTGLTAASDATKKKIDFITQEASKLKLSRLGAALRFAGDEMGRHLEKSAAFSRRRFVFFAGRAWLLGKMLAHALRQKDDAMLGRLLLAQQAPVAVPRLEVVTLGVAKRVATGTQVAFELRLRSLSDIQGFSARPRILWSVVFAHRDGVPPEAFLHLPQPQKFNPKVFLEKKSLVLENVALAPDDSGGARLMLGPKTTVTQSKKDYGQWSDHFDWSPQRALDRVRRHEVSPLDLEVELAEEVVLEQYSLGSPTAREDRGQVVYPMQCRGTELEVVAPSGADGRELRTALDAIRTGQPPGPMFGVMHYELGSLVLQPLSIIGPEGPAYLPISSERIDTTTLLKSIKF